MGSPRVLIVDDEPGVRTSLAAVLSLDGYHVGEAASADEALARLRAAEHDVVISDLLLDSSELDGISLLERIRAEWPDLPVILMTGYASVRSAIGAVQAGAYAYLTKPCDIEEMKVTVARAAERARLGRELRRRMAELEAANASLQRLSAEQQRRIDDATAALRRKVSELEEAQRRVEQAQRQREQFISEVVHELRGPMTGLYGYAHLLGEPALAPERQERARNMVLASVRRLNRLLEDLTDAAQLQAGRFRVQLAEADLAEVVREQVEQAAAQLGPQSRHRLLLEAPASLALLCDRDRVGQVLGNLMNNALKYTPGGDLHVSLCRDGSSAIVSVADSGPGIPKESLEAVFKPHVRLRREEAADKTAPRGSGLGLYISRGIVEAHGGRMWAERNGAGGTTFTFTLPATQ